MPRLVPPFRWLMPLLALLASSADARAHVPFKGMGDVVNGALHPLTTPTHVLLIIGLGLMAGRQTVRELKAPFWIFAPVSALAFAWAGTGWVKLVPPPIFILLTFCAGTLLALEKIPPRKVICALFAIAALALGLDSAVQSDAALPRIKTLLGNWVSVNILVFDIAIYITLGGQAKWLKVALRVAGSWLVAISLMVLAFSFRK